MATDAQIGQGLQLKRGAGSPLLYDTIAEVTEIGDFGSESALVEVTHFQSDAREYINGLKDGVEFPITVNFIPGDQSHIDLRADHDARRLVLFQLIFPPQMHAGFKFSGLVRKWNLAGTTPDGALKASFSIKVSGAIEDMTGSPLA